MQKDIQKVTSSKLARSCVDVKLEDPTAASGHYTIDPNLGSTEDAVKGYCDFGKETPLTCVHNNTVFSQLNYLHLLHTKVSQSIQLPCTAQGPFR